MRRIKADAADLLKGNDGVFGLQRRREAFDAGNKKEIRRIGFDPPHVNMAVDVLTLPFRV
jgi:hypothetical protein